MVFSVDIILLYIHATAAQKWATVIIFITTRIIVWYFLSLSWCTWRSQFRLKKWMLNTGNEWTMILPSTFLLILSLQLANYSAIILKHPALCTLSTNDIRLLHLWSSPASHWWHEIPCCLFHCHGARTRDTKLMYSTAPLLGHLCRTWYIIHIYTVLISLMLANFGQFKVLDVAVKFYHTLSIDCYWLSKHEI